MHPSRGAFQRTGLLLAEFHLRTMIISLSPALYLTCNCKPSDVPHMYSVSILFCADPAGSDLSFIAQFARLHSCFMQRHHECQFASPLLQILPFSMPLMLAMLFLTTSLTPSCVQRLESVGCLCGGD
eukprot:1036828-Pelagomonas_calceolata.AAC.1